MFRRQVGLEAAAASYYRYKKVPGGLPKADRFYTSCLCLLYLTFWLACFLWLLLGLPTYIEPARREHELVDGECLVDSVGIAKYPSVKSTRFAERDPPKLLSCSLDTCQGNELCGVGFCVHLSVNTSLASLPVQVAMPTLSTYKIFEEETIAASEESTATACATAAAGPRPRASYPSRRTISSSLASSRSSSWRASTRLAARSHSRRHRQRRTSGARRDRCRE
mmetsp:Transcript_46447/g.100907  ORF Transcript_46447/g.100907 Transcript_46447/m.100907 type:complete len:223 (-) Transcript_46447:867-1535(-)